MQEKKLYGLFCFPGKFPFLAEWIFSALESWNFPYYISPGFTKITNAEGFIMKNNCGRRSVRYLFPVLVILFSAGCRYGALHLEKQMESDLPVKELIRRMNRATDPRKEYFSCKSYRMRQSLSVMESGTKDQMSLEVCFQAPDKVRITTFRGEKPTVVEIYNGGRAWSIDCGTGRVRKVPKGLPLELMRIYTQQATPALDATQIFRKVDVDMNVDKKGYKTYRLICDAGVDGIAPYVYYINGQT